MSEEVEILWRLNTEIDDARQILCSIPYKGSKRTIDTYFYDPTRKDLQPDENGKIWKCLRVRNSDGAMSITYKNDHYNEGIWQYSDEHESQVSCDASVIKIIKELGLVELVIVDNIKHKYISLDGNYEVVLEQVANLGNFIEVEWKSTVDGDISDIRDKIRQFVASLGVAIGDEMNAGKPELLIKLRM